MAYHEGWVYLLEFLIVYAMRYKYSFMTALGGLLLIYVTSISQSTIATLKATPQEELIDKLPDDSSRLMVHYIISKNKENSNILELKKRDIVPAK